jgi:hypothetical protein
LFLDATNITSEEIVSEMTTDFTIVYKIKICARRNRLNDLID